MFKKKECKECAVYKRHTSGSITLLQNCQLHIRTVDGCQKNTISEIQWRIFNNLQTTNFFFIRAVYIIGLRDIN